MPQKTGDDTLTKPMRPSEALARITGPQAIPRSEVTRRIWDYIKKHDLQDPANRRLINADETLRPIFGGKSKVSMFEMTALLAKQLQ